MSDLEPTHFTDVTALMATRKYGKVPSGHPIGSLLGVYWESVLESEPNNSSVLDSAKRKID